jgi:hypothetical protein
LKRDRATAEFGYTMAEKLDEKELVTVKEMMMANSIQVDALAQLLEGINHRR